MMVPSFRGEHNADVLSEWAGIAPEEIDRLVNERVLLAEKSPKSQES